MYHPYAGCVVCLVNMEEEYFNIFFLLCGCRETVVLSALVPSDGPLPPSLTRSLTSSFHPLHGYESGSGGGREGCGGGRGRTRKKGTRLERKEKSWWSRRTHAKTHTHTHTHTSPTSIQPPTSFPWKLGGFIRLDEKAAKPGSAKLYDWLEIVTQKRESPSISRHLIGFFLDESWGEEKGKGSARGGGGVAPTIFLYQLGTLHFCGRQTGQASEPT
ncbi:hypothetical protein B0T26DRAFT_272576 [Lasiosphaeria miniovina]|uniref:Uncharacterized protein n=1 Tax=Lasiosphaeria miniovina TaxID=1954250 RepID=A0AA40DXT2_9PEZI|nr:uncharacterized protein B0T26DRAFT_272576 [Lasiosphaeria miniovina]KAK0716976.1 hypothetical protein B0T26DRAFT_272576 [Lasiosphaeria miniovina]